MLGLPHRRLFLGGFGSNRKAPSQTCCLVVEKYFEISHSNIAFPVRASVSHAAKMSQVKAVRLASFPQGNIKTTDFSISSVDLGDLSAGQFLVKTLFLSVDPYMRGRMRESAPKGYYITLFKKDEVLTGGGVGRVVQSNNSNFAVGDLVSGFFPWQEQFVSDGSGLQKLPSGINVPASYYIGVLGLPGMTAYFGFLDICNPQPNETVVVSSAAGAVGLVVGQIAKIKGCRVVGIAGSDDKLAYLKSVGFDEVINYKTDDVAKALAEKCPKGVDCYFDNVGGAVADAVISQMNARGRVSCCGSISAYSGGPDVGPRQYANIVVRSLKVQGFIVTRDYGHRYPEGIKQMTEWVTSGQVKSEETVVNGIDNMGQALVELFEGKNTGKMVVKISE
eukprot:TRINITY_DN3027_c0_g1_i1.p1 TRINITY_DN3027_c0_g1~~TRINITY_DN3027_c0_g1_i1.p1  ORF type:complete len:391 (+),score=92.40 TRINITY_DN3027_c0_g1_i1:874-2046(+)